jgi:two-component system phosphate regulon sensor histidine kinase PhoR
VERHADAVIAWALLAGACIAGIAALWRWYRGRLRARMLMRFAAAVAGEADAPPLPPALRGLVGDWQRTLVEVGAALRESLRSARGGERRLQAVLGGMVEGVLVIDHAGTVVVINRRAEQILDLMPGQYAGRSLIELTRHPDLHELVQWVMSAGGLARPSAREIALDGSRQQVLRVTATPLAVAGDVGRAYILVFHDISELKRLERIRRDFVANVSHELRTPLAAIRGYTETLLGGALDDADRARRFLGIVERHTDRLGRLVDDLLTLSDLELGRTALRRAPVAASSIAEATFEVLRHKAAIAGIALEQEIAPDTPKVNADEDRLEQAILNLVDNAIKYTPQGGRVTFSAHPAPGSRAPEGVPVAEEARFVELTVTDTGVGVPPEDLPRLTERFYRVDKARSRELGGTGLGLAIVKHIVQAHGGWMHIESQVNHGTSVRLYVPAFDGADDLA